MSAQRQSVARGLAAVVIGALALTTLRAADHTSGPSAERSHAAVAVATRAHVSPPSHLVGVVGFVVVFVAAMAWCGTTIGAASECARHPVSPIRRRGPPSLQS